MPLTEVELVPRSIDRWRDILSTDRWDGLEETVRLGRSMCSRPFWCINSTAVGGGVAEMLRTLLSYIAGVGFDAHWGVISGDNDFFKITKRIHNFVHGNPGDGGELGWQQRNAYHRTIYANVPSLIDKIPRGSVVILHDPQTAGLVDPLQRHGCVVLWRCHIGTEVVNDYTEAAWNFLEPFVSDADRLIFSRNVHVPEVLRSCAVSLVSPSIDPFAPKNQRLNPERRTAILTTTGLLKNQNGIKVAPTFYRLSGETDKVTSRAMLLGGSTGLTPGRPLVLQVSRWDRLKDHAGVMQGFLSRTLSQVDAELALVGPHVGAVADDPEGAAQLEALTSAHAALPDDQRQRVHIISLPTTDVEENAAVVNALQRYATVVVQKSLEEGFGLTVTEALYKARPVIASRVGGICDQIQHDKTGVLLDDPQDLEVFGDELARLLTNAEHAQQLGQTGYADVHQRFLHDHHIRSWLRVSATLGRTA